MQTGVGRGRIVHVTSVHGRDDTRIRHKMCASLVDAGFDVVLVVADGGGDEASAGVSIIDVGRPPNRAARIFLKAHRVARKARALDPDIIHFHDPELLPAIACMGVRSRARTIFDAHENVPDQLLSKAYLPQVTRRPVSSGYAAIERVLVPKLDAVIVANPRHVNRYSRIHRTVECVANFPMADELAGPVASRAPEHAVCYVGGITATRGIGQMVDALALTRSRPRLKLAGRFARASDREAVSRSPGWSLVDELGHLDRSGVRSTLATSIAGLATLQPTPAYLDAYPTKLFEYMSAGMPVIASDFPLYRDVVEKSECGLCVDPTDPAAIARAIDRLVGDEETARRMGENGRRAVETTYRWSGEAEKLVALYDAVLQRRQA